MELTSRQWAGIFADRYNKGSALADAVYRAFYKQLYDDPAGIPEIMRSPGLGERLRRDLDITHGQVIREVRQDGVVKFVTRLVDGHRIESVVIPMARHDTVCVSSQVGCRMGCRFCETARMGLVRQLRCGEIVDQVYTARQRHGARLRNVVFMGMGEPFDNADAVFRAIGVMNDQKGLDVPLRRITLSTCGLADGMERLANEGLHRVRLAVSLNAADDDLRDRLMPVNRTTPLETLRRRLLELSPRLKDGIMLSYVLMAGINDTTACADRLADWMAPLKAKVNLIPFNPVESFRFGAPDISGVDAFRNHLIARGVNVQKRATRGHTVAAACGQLGGSAAPGEP